MVSSTPRPHFTHGKDPVPILQEAGWAPGPVWTVENNKEKEIIMRYTNGENCSGYCLIHYWINVKVKVSRYRPGVAQKVGRCIALLFRDHGTRRG